MNPEEWLELANELKKAQQKLWKLSSETQELPKKNPLRRRFEIAQTHFDKLRSLLEDCMLMQLTPNERAVLPENGLQVFLVGNN